MRLAKSTSAVHTEQPMFYFDPLYLIIAIPRPYSGVVGAITRQKRVQEIFKGAYIAQSDRRSAVARELLDANGFVRRGNRGESR